MLQTLIWRSIRMAPPKIALGGGRQRQGTSSLPRVSVLVGALALACGGLWTAHEYAQHRVELRLAETNRFLEQFRSGPVADAWARLRTAWRAEEARQDALVARIPAAVSRERARTVHDHQMFVLETIEEYHLQDDIEVVHRFLIRLAMCVRIGNCDAQVVAAQLGPALWAFRDQHHYYFEFEYSGIDLDRELATIAPRPRAPDAPASPRW